MQLLLFAGLAVMLTVASNTNAAPMNCETYLQDAAKAQAAGTLDEFLNQPTISSIHLLATGADLALSRISFSNMSAEQRGDVVARLAIACGNQPQSRAADVAIAIAWAKYSTTEKAVTPDKTDPDQPTPQIITAEQINAGLSSTKTELEHERWWNEIMSRKLVAVHGTVVQVERGTFSGYWVNLDIGRNIRVRCGMDDAFESIAQALKKGSAYTCTGIASSTWTTILGITFSIEASIQS